MKTHDLDATQPGPPAGWCECGPHDVLIGSPPWTCEECGEEIDTGPPAPAKGITDARILARVRTLSGEHVRRIERTSDSQRLRKAAAQVLAERRAEALTLDCPEPVREVPTGRIRKAVENAIEHHEIAFLGGPLRSVLRTNPMVGDDGADTIFGDLSRAITAAVVEVLGGES